MLQEESISLVTISLHAEGLHAIEISYFIPNEHVGSEDQIMDEQVRI